jgi:phosphotransferase family enzyme
VNALLDPAAAAPLLGESEARITYLRYKPGRRLVVQYAVGQQVAVAIADAKAGGGDRVSVQWLPVDAALPALVLSGPELARRLNEVGVPAEPVEPELLAYRPLKRAVLRLGRHVLKLYGDDDAFTRACDGFALAARLNVPTLVGSIVELRLLVLERLEGTVLDDPLPRAAELGALLRELHALDRTRLRSLPVEATHAAVEEAVELLETIDPPTARRAARVARRLAATAPTGLPVETSHADFEAGQVLVTEDGLALLDLDDLAAAAPALDFANCAAHLLRRPGEGLDRAFELLDGLASGYGSRPPALEWFLACRLLCSAPVPFRHGRPDWRERASDLVAAAEAA